MGHTCRRDLRHRPGRRRCRRESVRDEKSPGWGSVQHKGSLSASGSFDRGDSYYASNPRGGGVTFNPDTTDSPRSPDITRHSSTAVNRSSAASIVELRSCCSTSDPCTPDNPSPHDTHGSHGYHAHFKDQSSAGATRSPDERVGSTPLFTDRVYDVRVLECSLPTMTCASLVMLAK